MQSPSLSVLNGPRSGVAGLEFQPFSHLKAMPAEPPWLWAGFLAPGSLTMLVGNPFAGKSTLVAGLVRALEQGGPFLGRSTRKATTLLISEEDDYAIHSRASVLGLLGLRSEYAGRNGGVFSRDWASLIEQSSEHAFASGHSLLVIDTFPGLAGLRGEEENDAGAVGERLRPLQRAAGEGLAVLFLHHLNKVGQPRGSQAFSGVVDIRMRLHKSRGNGFRIQTETRFATGLSPSLGGRLVQVPHGWFYEMGTGTPTVSSQKAAESTDDRLLAALVAAGADGMTYSEFDTIPGLSSDLAKKRFPAWHPERIVRIGNGRKGNPYRWVAKTA